VGRVEEGIAQMRQGLAALQATGTELLRPYNLALLAEACGSGGQIEAGLSALEEALVTAENHTERFYEAELHRLKGELVLQKFAGAGSKPALAEIRRGHAADIGATGRSPLQMEAEADFQSALNIARRQGAKSLELRAALSLSRLWQQQDKRREARQLLADIYGWFAEGFETADLQEARALLEDLT
jgi:predicted ATPase